MRHFFRLSLSALFILLLPAFLLLAVPKLNGFTVDKVKSNLRHNQTYDKASAVIQQRVSPTNSSDQEIVAENQIGTLIASEFTPDYLQTKIESLLDQTAAWTIDPSKEPPAISFNDLQRKIVAKNPAIKQQLDTILSEIQANKSQLDGQLPQVTGDEQSQQALQDLLQSSDNIESVANGDWTFSLRGPLAGLPTIYQYYAIGLPLLVLFLALCLAGVFALGMQLPGRLAGVGWTLIISAIWNILLSGIFWAVVVSGGLLRVVPLSDAEGDLTVVVIRSIQSALFERYLTIELFGSGLLLVIGIMLLVGSKLAIPKKTPVNPTLVIAQTESEAKPESKGGTGPAGAPQETVPAANKATD